jgi:hypothetical protein
MARGVETIVRVRKVKQDPLKPSSSSPVANATFKNCEVLPRQPVETERGLVGLEGWDVFCFDPESVDPVTKLSKILHTDQITLRGETYNVIGEPRPFTKKGRFKMLQITLSKVS